MSYCITGKIDSELNSTLWQSGTIIDIEGTKLKLKS